MVRHQAPPPNADLVTSAVIDQKVAITLVIHVAEKRSRPPVTSLGHVVRNMWKDDAGEPFGSDPAYWRSMSPTLNLAAGAAPLLVVCSSRRAESCGQAGQFAERAGQLGVRAEVLRQDLSHGEINSQLGTPGAYTAAVETFLAGLDGEVARRLR